jgi:2-methylcitrate dehydratase PrpD
MHASPAPNKDGLTAQLIDWTLRLRWSDVPADAQRAARRHLLDTLGCIVAGAQQPLTRRAAATLAAVRQGGELIVPGLAQRTDLLDAVYLAGVSAHGLELDDGYREGSTHPGAVVVPVALATAMEAEASIEDLLTAVVAGYEVMTTIARLAHPAMRRRGFHPTATSGVFGATVAAARLRKLNREQFANALGVAGSSAAGLFAFVSGGADVKRLHPGHSAREGVFAVLLAERGLQGPPAVLEGPDGFFQAFADAQAARAPVALPPAGEWGVTRCYLKPYPCCRHLHPALDAILEIAATHPLRAEDVERIDIETYGIAAAHAQIGWGDFASSQLSFPFAVATMLRHGGVELEHFGDAARADAATTALCPRVHVTASEAMDVRYKTGRPARVTITVGGQTFSAERDEALGSPQQPLDRAAVDRKFATLIDDVVGGDQRGRLQAMLWGEDPSVTVCDLLQSTLPKGTRS